MKNYLLILLIFIFVIVIIMPVNGIAIQKLDEDSITYHSGSKHSKNKYTDSLCFDEYNKKCKYYGYNQIKFYIKGTHNEINKIKFINIKIGKKSSNVYQYSKIYSKTHIGIHFKKFMKGNIKDKNYNINIYNKQGKIIKNKKGKIDSVYSSLEIITKSH